MRRHEKIAEVLVEEAGITKAPVPVEKLARRKGATIRYREFDGGVSGVLVRTDDGEFVVGVHATQPRVRQRFTIAHELGHLVLHPGRPIIVEQLKRGARVNWRDGASSGAKDTEEIQANQFAAALLMPTKLLEGDYWRLVKAGVDDEDLLVERLARNYDVSPQAMRFRLLNLALIDPA